MEPDADGGSNGGDDHERAGHVLYEMEKFGYLDHPPSHTIQPHATDANAQIIQKRVRMPRSF